MRFPTLDAWLTWQKTSHVRTIDLSLDRVEQVFSAMGIHYKPLTITVAGTNGKGSTVAMLDAILREQGYRVGTYSSPHIVRYNERIRINGVAVEDARIMQAFEQVDALRGDISLSFFEFGTLAALDIFAASKVDVQLLEVGLGGRLDAVNVIDADVPIITSIAIDHVHWLGDTRSEIALEKAGVMRSGIPAVVGEPDVPSSLLDWATQQQIPLQCSGLDYHYQLNADSWNWQAAGYSSGHSYQALPLPALSGPHQVQNAAAVLQALCLLEQRLPVTEQSIRTGLQQVKLAGRFHCIPTVQNQHFGLVIDVAHNPESACVLAENIRQHFPQRRILALFSVMADKDISRLIADMKNNVDQWYPVPLEIERAASTTEIIEALTANGISQYHRGLENFEQAWKMVCNDVIDANDLILIFGSFFLVSEYYQYHPAQLNY